MKAEDAVILLKEKGYRITPQRVAVLKALIGNKRHPTVEQLHKVALKSCKNISLATVYNVLQILEDVNLVRSRSFSGTGLRYDPDTTDHAHFVCHKCRNIYDMRITAPPRDSIPVGAVRGFKISGYEIVLRGTCKSCLQSQRKVR
ncbi:MAG TPA: hypothetical protein DCE14_02070 [Kosmotogaceae bacterium]|nr:MAG: Ferric uptake regulator, Fur family [Thermotogales bacterium 46_20]HAA85119.1 hypothetical protein [Kosmotogaceae bacterium]